MTWEVAGPDAQIVDALRPRQPRSVLDIGCGEGALTAYIARELHTKVVGIDSSRAQVAIARRNGIDAIVADVESLPFPNRRFDCALAAWSLHLVDDLDRALAEIARVLEPGGRLVCMTASDMHMGEIWRAFGVVRTPSLFSAENGKTRLSEHFSEVSCQVSRRQLVFSRQEDAMAYARTAIFASDPSSFRTPTDPPLAATTVSALFIADRPTRDFLPRRRVETLA